MTPTAMKTEYSVMKDSGIHTMCYTLRVYIQEAVWGLGLVQFSENHANNTAVTLMMTNVWISAHFHLGTAVANKLRL